jgi:pSer/pThr/pTyr-binding forkhead associated (FHA) protein
MKQNSISVRLMSGPQDGLQILLPMPGYGEETAWMIGRSDECEICLSYDTQVSRTHARLICANSDETVAAENADAQRVRFTLVDVGSRNGTYLGERHLKDELADLEPGQLFRIGRTWLRVDL